MKENTKKSFFYSGLFLLLFIYFNILLTTSLFIIKVSVFKYCVPVSLVTTIIAILILLKKNDFLKHLKCIFISIILPIIIIIISIYVNGKVLDHSFDGNTYHKATIGLLKNGWNPIYEKAEEFDKKQKNPIYIEKNIEKTDNRVWINHYARASHIFQANIYKFTNNIECGKAINTISLIALFFITFSYLAQKLKKIFFAFMFSLCTISPSVVGAQYLTNYIDLLVYLYLTLLIISFFILEFYKNKNEKIDGFILYFVSLSMLINIKFTSFAYAGIYCLGYYIYYIVKLKNKKIEKEFFINFTSISIICVLVSIFIIGLAVYPKNIKTNGNPLYPLFGNDSVDIITQNQPDYFENKNTIEKFTISMFSKVENIAKADKKKATYKIPFTYNNSELEAIKTTDARISGNGVLFSGIFIITIISLFISGYKMYKEQRKVFLMSLIPLLITISLIFILSESWWARYFPQIYYLVLLNILFLSFQNKKSYSIFLSILICLIIYNNSITIWSSTKYSYDLNINSNNEYRLFLENNNNKDYKLYISSPIFIGTTYNIFDKMKGYEIVTEYKPIDEVSDYNIFMSGLIYWRGERTD